MHGMPVAFEAGGCVLCMDTAGWEVNINHVVSFHCWRLGTVERLYNTYAHYSVQAVRYEM